MSLWRSIGAMAAHVALWFGLVLAVLPAHAADDGITEFLTVPAGSYIIDTGSLTPTVANALKPYGAVYDLVRNQKVPVWWSINPSKAKDGPDFTNPATGKAYRAGPFIVRADFITPAVLAVINAWRAQGVVIDGPITTAISGVPIYDSISGLANLVLDTQNGAIAGAYLTAAGVPAAAYRVGLPASLTSCDDMYVMPHADPTWTTHRNLLPFVQSRGYIWAACHSVSVLENVDIPSTPTVNPDLNFLTLAGMVPFGSHDDGSIPYTQAEPADPVMQFIGITDTGQLNGSEQIYLPRLLSPQGLPTGGWRPGARLLVTDPTQANVPSLSPGPAAAMVYGRAFDNPANGRVMYEGGHNHAGTTPANIGAQRAFLNFWLLALIDRSPDVVLNTGGINVVNEGGTMTLSSSVTHNFPVATYQWTSSAGGVFSAPNSPTTQFTAPDVTSDTLVTLRLTVTDGCNRSAFDTTVVRVANVTRADLAIAKSDSKDPVSVNEAFSYSLAVSNLGPDSASTVVVDDVLPAGLGFVSAAGTGWACTYDSGTRRVQCTRASLAVTGATPSVITVNVTAPATSSSITNTATVSSASNDTVPGNNSSNQTTRALSGIDVEMTKTAPASVYAGATFNYTLGVRNLGGAAATNLTVSDPLPAALTFVSATGTGWSCSYNPTGSIVNCSLPTLAAGATAAPITLRVTASVASAGTPVANTATVSSPSFSDDVPGNNSATATVTPLPTADLALTKTGSTTGGGNGQIDTFVVTLSNNGPGVAADIVVNDVMSGQSITDYASGCTVTPSVGTTNPAAPTWTLVQIQAGGNWTIASLASGASATLTFACTGNNNNGVLNRATITSSTSFDPDSGNNTASAFVVDGTPENADLQLVKTSTPTTVVTGGTVTYRIRVNNLSAVSASGLITVRDTLPADSAYVRFDLVTGGGTWTCPAPVGGVLTCTTPTNLPAGENHEFDVVITAPTTPGVITNTATVSHPWGQDRYDPPANNTGTAQTTVVFPTTDISLTKTVNNATPSLGANVTFTITASNIGPNAASNLRVRDLLPAGLDLVSFTAAQGSYDPATGLWFIGPLAASASTTLSITATTTQGTTITNQACRDSMDQSDSSAANDCASVQVFPQVADLRVTKTVDNANPPQTGNVTFTVTLTNLGAGAPTGIVVQDALPDGLRFVSATASVGTYSSTAGQWQIVGPLANGASATLTIVATATVAETPLTNTAAITASSLPDNVTTNNSSSATVTARASDIAVTKTVDISAPAELDQTVTFTVTARNNGPSAASTVTITDVLPSGLTYVSHGSSQGAYAPVTGVWDVGALALGATATLTLRATNTQFGTLTNTATRTASAPVDLGPTNDSASAQVLSGGSADLALTKVVDRPFPVQGDTVTFTLQLDNAGPNAATGVVVEDLLPAGLTYVTHAASQGTYDNVSGLWTVGALAAPQRVTLTITARVTGSGDITNTTRVRALNQADPDTTNNSSLATISVFPAADLFVTKTGPATVPLGSSATYIVTVRNAGPTGVTGASLQDTVPSQLTVTGWTCVATGGADCNTTTAGTGATGTGNAISLNNIAIPAGAVHSVQITVNTTASTAGTITNTAVITPPSNLSVVDPNTTNNSASVQTVISNSRLSGRVFADTGTGGGVANDGIVNGGELGLASVTVRLTNCSGTEYSTTTTDGAGNYTLGIPSTLAAGAPLCVVQTNLSGYVSTGAQVGNTGGTYTRASDTVQLTLGSGGEYTGVNFGDVPDNRFLTDGSRTALPGSTVTFPHTYIAGTGGEVTFSLQATSSPSGLPWQQLLFRDTNCDGVLDTPGDTRITAPLTVAAGERVCLLQQQFVPANAPQGASNQVTIQAQFVYTNASPALASTTSRQDLTIVSDTALSLIKEVRNVTLSGVFGSSNAARPGDVLEYRITFTNMGVASMSNLVINDTTPAYTVFVSAACGTPLPANLSTCTITAPAVGASGAVRWQFMGSLVSALSGVVTYQVRVQ